MYLKSDVIICLQACTNSTHNSSFHPSTKINVMSRMSINCNLLILCGRSNALQTSTSWFCKLENKKRVDEVTITGVSSSNMTFRHSN